MLGDVHRDFPSLSGGCAYQRRLRLRMLRLELRWCVRWPSSPFIRWNLCSFRESFGCKDLFCDIELSSSGSKVWKEKPTLEGKVHGLFPPEIVQQAHIIQLKLRWMCFVFCCWGFLCQIQLPLKKRTSFSHMSMTNPSIKYSENSVRASPNSSSPVFFFVVSSSSDCVVWVLWVTLSNKQCYWPLFRGLAANTPIIAIVELRFKLTPDCLLLSVSIFENFSPLAPPECRI